MGSPEPASSISSSFECLGCLAQLVSSDYRVVIDSDFRDLRHLVQPA